MVLFDRVVRGLQSMGCRVEQTHHLLILYVMEAGSLTINMLSILFKLLIILHIRNKLLQGKLFDPNNTKSPSSVLCSNLCSYLYSHVLCDFQSHGFKYYSHGCDSKFISPAWISSLNPNLPTSYTVSSHDLYKTESYLPDSSLLIFPSELTIALSITHIKKS